jgi:hypothetical protein
LSKYDWASGKGNLPWGALCREFGGVSVLHDNSLWRDLEKTSWEESRIQYGKPEGIRKRLIALTQERVPDLFKRYKSKLLAWNRYWEKQES